MTDTTTPVSIVDILSDAYAKINRAPWVLVIPLILNAYLWFGGGISIAPLVTETQALLREIQPDASTPDDVAEMREQTIGLLAQLAREDIRGQVAWLNVVPYTIYSFRAAGASAEALGLPYIMALHAPTVDANAWIVADAGSFLGLIVLINWVALVLSAIFLAGMRNAAIDAPQSHDFVHQVARVMTVLFLYVMLVIGVVGLSLIPLSIFLLLLLSASPALGAFFVFVGAGAWLWASIYIGFTREIMVLEQVGPIRGIQMSVRLVRVNFWRTLSFLFMLLVIVAGSGIIFEGLIGTFAGQVASIIVSAYLLTGLVMARMRFVQYHLQQGV
ncbi:MAG: hypothetical protein ACKO83_04345 [Roseiflexaceae bacterium]